MNETTETPKEKSKEYSLILYMYGGLGASILFSFVPNMIFASVAFVVFTIVFFAAYIIRGKHGENTLAHNHMHYIIRTIWIFSLFAAVTTSIASFYILSRYDPTPLFAYMDNVMGVAMNMDMNAIMAVFKPCIDEFIHVNFRVFLIGGLAAGIPLIAYLALRLYKGINTLHQNKLIPDLKSWF